MTVFVPPAMKPEPAPGKHQKVVRRSLPVPLAPAFIHSAATVLQRKPSCACGGGCPRCQEKHDHFKVQTKLAVSSPGDQFEREADAVADQVMRMTDPALRRQGNACSDASAPGSTDEGLLIKRQANGAGDSGEVASDFTSSLGSGVPLDAASRHYFEPRFRHDFGNVRVHDGPQAATAAASIQARAFTLGRNVVFAAGEHDPGSDGGRRLLAHELTHVVQQSGAAGIVHGNRIHRQPAAGKNTCSIRTPLYGWDNIRNISRERLRAAGFEFCGPDRDFGDPALWERWVHPTKGVLHFQVKWKDEPNDPAPPPEPDKPDDRQKRCADPCMAKTDDEAACKKCCVESIPAEDTQCRRTCDVACSLMLSSGPTDEPSAAPSAEPSAEPEPDDE